MQTSNRYNKINESNLLSYYQQLFFCCTLPNKLQTKNINNSEKNFSQTKHLTQEKFISNTNLRSPLKSSRYFCDHSHSIFMHNFLCFFSFSPRILFQNSNSRLLSRHQYTSFSRSRSLTSKT